MNGGVINRKEREDKGASVFTCEKRRKTEFTPYKKIKKKRSQDWRDSMGKLTASDLKSEWDQLDDLEKKVFIDKADANFDKADANLLRGPFLATDRAGRIFPMLDPQAEHRRVHWAKAF